MSRVRFAKILNTHGIKGECKIALLDDFGNNIFSKDIEVVAVPSQKKLTVAARRTHKGFELVIFKEITDMNGAELLKNEFLEIEEENLCEKEDGSYYNYELIGLETVSEEGEHLGVISAIESTPANDVIRITRSKGRDLLVPFVDAFVMDIDLEENKMIIHVIEGLL